MSSEFEVVFRQVLYRSPILLTPYSDADTIDKLNPAEFNRCVASMAVMAFTVADLKETLAR